MEVIIFVLIVVVVIYVVIKMVDWFVHISMVKDNCTIHGWSNYKRFVSEFKRYEWNDRLYFKSSLFNRDKGCQFHANIIEFEYKGMIMRTPIDFILCKRFVNKYIKKNFKMEKIWK